MDGRVRCTHDGFRLVGLIYWFGTDSDDDNGGGLMQPALVPVRVNRR